MARILESQTLGGSGFREVTVWWDMEQGWNGYRYTGGWSWIVGDTTKKPAGHDDKSLQIFLDGAAWGPILVPGSPASFFSSSAKAGQSVQICEYDGGPVIDPHPAPIDINPVVVVVPSPTPSPSDTSNSTLEDPGVGTGSIEGTIYADDGSTSTPLIGAHVTFEGITTTSIIGGYYRLDNCPLMSSLLTAELVPYGPASVGVSPISGAVVTVNLGLLSPFAPVTPSDGGTTPTQLESRLFSVSLPFQPNQSQVNAYKDGLGTWLPIMAGVTLLDCHAESNVIVVSVHQKYAQNAIIGPTVIYLLIAAAILIFGIVPIVTGWFDAQKQAWVAQKTITTADAIAALTDARNKGIITEAEFQAAVKALETAATTPVTDDWTTTLAKYGAIAAVALIGVLLLSKQK